MATISSLDARHAPRTDHNERADAPAIDDGGGRPGQDTAESTDRNVGFLISDSARLLRVNYDRRMKELGLTRAQWWVLTHLYFHEGISQTELSGILDVERATLGRLLDRLEAKGWIERRADARDRRLKRVFLTGEVGSLMRTMLVRKATPAGASGRVFGFVYSGLDLGSALMPVTLGLILDRGAPELVFYAIAGLLFCTALTVVQVRRRTPARPLQPAADA